MNQGESSSLKHSVYRIYLVFSLKKMTRACLVVQLCPTLCDPIDYSPSGSSVHEIFQVRILEWVAISSSRGVVLTQGSNLSLLHLLP